MVLYILIMKFYRRDGKTKDCEVNDSKHSAKLISS